MSQAICIVRWQTEPSFLFHSPPSPQPVPASRRLSGPHTCLRGPWEPRGPGQAMLPEELAAGQCQASRARRHLPGPPLSPSCPQAATGRRSLPAPALPGRGLGGLGWGAERPRLHLHPSPLLPLGGAPLRSPRPGASQSISPAGPPDRLARLPMGSARSPAPSLRVPGLSKALGSTLRPAGSCPSPAISRLDQHLGLASRVAGFCAHTHTHACSHGPQVTGGPPPLLRPLCDPFWSQSRTHIVASLLCRPGHTWAPPAGACEHLGPLPGALLSDPPSPPSPPSRPLTRASLPFV